MLKNNYNYLFELSKKIVYLSLIFLFPLFFLTTTQEFFVTNKLYFLAFGALLLLLTSSFQLLITKKFIWTKRPFDKLVLLFLGAMAISVIFASPNKIQALLNPSFGLVMMISLAILYFYLSRVRTIHELSLRVLSVSSVLLSILTIIFYFQPFKNVSLPQSFAFLKSPGFTPIGSQLDLAIFLGFFVIMAIINLLKKGVINHASTKNNSYSIFNYSFLIINLLALFLTAYSLVKPIQLIQPVQLILPPFRLSWYAALEILKNPLAAFIGAGLDNFSSVFTRIKDFAYNQSPLWQINSFYISRSAILQILTETGILGLLTFGLLIFNAIKKLVKGGHGGPPLQIISLFVYLIICLLIFPSSLIVWFLFFVTLGVINHAPTDVQTQNFASLPTEFIIIIAIVSFILIGTSGYFLGRSYASEYYFKKSIDAITKNNLKEVYDNQRQAIILNPYIDRYRSGFAQTNLIIANNVSSRIKDNKLSEQDRQTITQAIQAAIAEGKAVVSLNPQRADGWQNLASIYLNVINTAKDADVWTISAYQRAIIADPQNPTYRVGLGGVYYSLKKYDEALRFFEQAISLKPDWPDASYNYAWANFQKKNYPQAVNAMQNTLSLLDPKLNKADYEKVKKELEEFKKMLPEEAPPEAR